MPRLLRTNVLFVLLLSLFVVALQAQQPPPSYKVAEDASAPQGWKRYDQKYGTGKTLSVALPGMPEESLTKSPVTPQSDVLTHMLTGVNDNGVYLVGYIEIPAIASMTEAVKREISDKLWEYFAAGLQKSLEEKGVEAKLSAETPVKTTVSGYDALKQHFMIGKMPGRYVAVIDEHQIYMAVSISFLASASDEATSFFNSVKILPSR